MSRSLLIVGSGGQGKMALECALSMEIYDKVSFMTSDLDRPAYLAGFEVVGDGAYSTRDVAETFDEVFIAIGNNVDRERVQTEYANAGARVATLVHCKASISRFARLGEGTIVMPQAAVNAFAKVGIGCIVNTGAVVEHDCIVSDWCHLSPGSRLGGWTQLGEGSWLCMGSTVSDHVRVCQGVTLAANSVLLTDVVEAGTYAGSPAKLHKLGLVREAPARECQHPDLRGKKILILAGAEPHVKVVEAARDLGVYTVVTDYLTPELSPAKLAADERWGLDIFDTEAIVARCREEQINGVLSLCIDPAQKPYQRICEQLGLPCYATRERVGFMTSKTRFKELCTEVGLHTVASYTESDIALDAVRYPVLVKPSESRGSRGQTICYDRKSALEAIAEAKVASPDGMAVIERYLQDAQDISLSYVVIGGVPHMLKCGDRTLGSVEDGLSTQHILTVSPSLRADVIVAQQGPAIQALVERLGIGFGLLFLQGLIDNGEVMFYDPGLRLPGSDFDLVIRNVTGFDPMKSAVEFALTGNAVSCWGDPVGVWRLNGGVAVILSVAVRPGMIGSFDGLDRVAADPRVYSAVRRLEVGDTVTASGDVRQRAAEFVAYLPGRWALGEFLEFVYDTVSIRDASGKDMVVSKAVALYDGSVIVS